MTIKLDPELIQEFLQEAHELLELMSRQLFQMDEAAKQNGPWLVPLPELFRATHTLKGMSAMFGYADVSEVAHGLEDLIERVQDLQPNVRRDVVDVLFDGVELIEQRLRPDVISVELPRGKMSELGQRLAVIVASLAAENQSQDETELDPEMLRVLSPEERRRIQQRINAGQQVYRVTKVFEVASLQATLQVLEQQPKKDWEILAYLPSQNDAAEGKIALDLFVATMQSAAQLAQGFGTASSEVRAVSLGRLMQKTQTGLQLPTMLPPTDMMLARETTTTFEVREIDGEVAPASTVRVPIHRLDGLIREVLELRRLRQELVSIADSLRITRRYSSLSDRLYRVGREFDRRLHALHGRVLEARMVPMSQVFERVTRMVRQTARALDKDVKVVTTGSETEIDKLIMEELVEPLTHLVRNALDHGVEDADERSQRKKNRFGTLVFNAYHQGGYVVVEVEDDGRGIDPSKLLAAAQVRGLLGPNAAQQMSEQEMVELVFESGVSTAAQLTDVSGRGVGLDAVKTKITSLGGMIDVRTQRGIGTKFTLTLPATLSLMSVILVQVNQERFAIPVTAIQQIISMSVDDIAYVGQEPVLRIGDQVAPLCFLSEVFESATEQTSPRMYAVIVYVGKRRLALVVHGLRGQEDVVVQALGASIRDVGNFLGAADVGDERPVLVLDVAALTLLKSAPISNAELAS